MNVYPIFTNGKVETQRSRMTSYLEHIARREATVETQNNLSQKAILTSHTFLNGSQLTAQGRIPASWPDSYPRPRVLAAPDSWFGVENVDVHGGPEPRAACFCISASCMTQGTPRTHGCLHSCPWLEFPVLLTSSRSKPIDVLLSLAYSVRTLIAISGTTPAIFIPWSGSTTCIPPTGTRQPSQGHGLLAWHTTPLCPTMISLLCRSSPLLHLLHVKGEGGQGCRNPLPLPDTQRHLPEFAFPWGTSDILHELRPGPQQLWNQSLGCPFEAFVIET